ncbi:MAG TPA: MFS transporter [Actinomycetaceae bacterium]|nr:MFS transporter [Actinomycetaceae bacterium]
MRRPRPAPFAAFRSGNFSRYFAGQLVSNVGLWFQNLALSLVVLELTGSATALALVTVAQFGPITLLGGVAGRIVDAVSARTVLLLTCVAAALASVALAVAVSQESTSLPLVYGLIALTGTAHAFERVASQALIYELVGPTLLHNAVALSTVYLSAARSIGPGLAGVAYLALGPAPCLLINAASYLAAVIALLFIRPASLHPRPRAESADRSVRAALRAVLGNRPLTVLLVVNVAVTVTAMNMNVVLTSIVYLGFGGDAGELGAVHALNAVGAIVGGLLVAGLRTSRVSYLVPGCLAFGAALAVNAAAPSLVLLLAFAPLLGLGLGTYQGLIYSAAQVSAEPHLIGRVMSLLTMGNVGMAPFGALYAGALVDATSGQTALAVGAGACVACAVLVTLTVLRPARAARRAAVPTEGAA